MKLEMIIVANLVLWLWFEYMFVTEDCCFSEIYLNIARIFASKFIFEALMTINKQNETVANVAKFVREICRFHKRMQPHPVK